MKEDETSEVNQSETAETLKDIGLCAPTCPVCGGHLIDIRGKLQCLRCHRICETCCEGRRG
jgi:hypothetical protein